MQEWGAAAPPAPARCWLSSEADLWRGEKTQPRGERQIPIPGSPFVLSHRAPCQLGLVKAPVGSQR